MKAQVVKCCHQFLEMQEEEVQPYLPTFVTAIWGLLVRCSSNMGQDNLALAAIAFLTTVGRSTHYSLFATGDTIRQVCRCSALRGAVANLRACLRLHSAATLCLPPQLPQRSMLLTARHAVRCVLW
jgi:hypothetical protein